MGQGEETVPGASGAPVGARVVVGVDGTRASVHAVRYAAAEAARLGVRVDVLHVVPDRRPSAGRDSLPAEDVSAAGRSTMRSTLERVGLDAAVPLTSHLEHGSVVATLVDAGRHARAMVLGSDRRPVSMRLLTGNVSTGVAARCSSPLVSVPETWGPEHPTGVVLAALKHHQESESLLAEAFALTRERGARLVVVHVVECTHRQDDLPWDREPVRARQERVLHDLETLVGPWREEFPDVDVEVRSLQGQAAHSLVLATEHADEIVILRRAHGVPPATHLGSTGRMVLLHSHCPVRVVTAEPVDRGSRPHRASALSSSSSD